MSTRIITNPGVCGGAPTIRGMRIRVADVLSHLAGGMSPAEILADSPYLEADDIRACLEFAAAQANGTGQPVITPAARAGGEFRGRIAGDAAGPIGTDLAGNWG